MLFNPYSKNARGGNGRNSGIIDVVNIPILGFYCTQGAVINVGLNAFTLSRPVIAEAEFLTRFQISKVRWFVYVKAITPR